MLRIRLLGELTIELDGEALPPPRSRPARGLFGWLLLHPGSHARSELAGRFWLDVLESSARTSLRTALVSIRQALGPAAERLETTRETVAFAAGDAWVDYKELDRLLEAGRTEEALALADGELLAGLDDDWVFEARDAL